MVVLKNFLPPSSDCKYRKGSKCSKTGKTIPLDVRDEEVKCWNRLWCDFYEKKV